MTIHVLDISADTVERTKRPTTPSPQTRKRTLNIANISPPTTPQCRKQVHIFPGSSMDARAPSGFRWNAQTYSCAYDSLFTILHEVFRNSRPWWTTCASRQNVFMRLLDTRLCDAERGVCSLEQARDDVRAALHAADPDLFPLTGTEGTDLYALCSRVLESR